MSWTYTDQNGNEIIRDGEAVAPRYVADEEGEPMDVHPTRTLLVHLNVEAPADGTPADEVAEKIMAAFQVGYEGSDIGPLTVHVALAEEI